ncbi:MAG: ABC transporter ATP-binding protein [Candidatus Margulisiibacteriota bacterium]|jgi:ABC-type lipoprotein export system ATPase subunit
METENNIIKIKDLVKAFKIEHKELLVLKKVSLDVATGDYSAIMGSSGSGKTTLLNIIGLLETLTEGSYHLFNQEVGYIKEKEAAQIRRKKIGYVFQKFNLLPRLKVVDNVALPLLLDGWNKRKAKERALTVLEKVNLGHRAEHTPKELSGGEQQRVSIARALVNKPGLLIADEPTGNLDQKSEEMVLEILEELNTEGITIIMVTHSPKVAKYAKKLIYLRNGELSSGQESIYHKI